jgi:Ankyrin repeats (3 copies)
MSSILNANAAVWTPSVISTPAAQREEVEKADAKQKRFAPRSKRPRQPNTERNTVPPYSNRATECAGIGADAPIAATRIPKRRTHRNHTQQQQQQRLRASADDAANARTALTHNARRRQQSKSSRSQAVPKADATIVTAADDTVTATTKHTTDTDMNDNTVFEVEAFPALPLSSSATAGKQAAAAAAAAVSYTALVDKLAAEQRLALSSLASTDNTCTTADDGVKLSLLEHKARNSQQRTVNNSSIQSTENAVCDDYTIADSTTITTTDATAVVSCTTAAHTVSVAARPSTELKERWRERWFTLESQRIAALQRQKRELQLMASEAKLPKTVTPKTVTDAYTHLQQLSYATNINSSSSSTANDSWHARLRPTYSTRQSILTAPYTVTVPTQSSTVATVAANATSNSSSSSSSSLYDTAAVLQSPVSTEAWFDAVRSNNVQAVIAMLNTGTIAWDTREDNSTTHRMTAVHIAAQCGHTSVLQALLSTANVAGTSVKDRCKATPLHYAVQIDRPVVHGMNADVQQQQQQQLHLQLQCVQLLLKHGARCDTKDRNGMTVLHIAAANGFIEAVSAILSNGRYKINTHNKHGATALRCAIEHSCMHNNSSTSNSDTTVYDDERDDNVVAVCSLLLAAGAAVDIPNDHGMTAVCTAAVYGATELLMMLLSVQQAKPSHTHTHHHHVTHRSTAMNSNSTNGSSVRSKANSSSNSSNGISQQQQPGMNMSLSPIHEAAAAGQTESVKMLINVSYSITIFK